MSAVKYIKRDNGESYPVRYDVNALCMFEEITGGKSLIRGMADVDVRFMRALVYVGLACGYEFEEKKFSISLNEVGKWNDLIKVVFPQCVDIMKQMTGGDEETGEDSKPGE